MTIAKTLASVSMAALLSGMAASAYAITIHDLPEKGNVALSGTVTKVKNEREFTLQDNTGTIDIDVTGSESVMLKEGDHVSVQGTVDKGLLSTDIDATRVTVDKNLSSAVSDSIAKTTGVTFDNSKEVSINHLPSQGLVKVSGTVEDVDSEKEFTLKDSTGEVDVSLKNNQNAVVSEGAKVTVIGYVNSGLTGKDIEATRIIIASK